MKHRPAGVAVRSLCRRGSQALRGSTTAAGAGLKLETYLAKHTGPDLDVALVARTLSIAPPEGLTVQELPQITDRQFAVRPIVEVLVDDGAVRGHREAPPDARGSAPRRHESAVLPLPSNRPALRALTFAARPRR